MGHAKPDRTTSGTAKIPAFTNRLNVFAAPRSVGGGDFRATVDMDLRSANGRVTQLRSRRKSPPTSSVLEAPDSARDDRDHELQRTQESSCVSEVLEPAFGVEGALED